jgi:integrase
MAGNYGINSFVMESGERYCLVVERPSSQPLFLPNLFITTQIRNKSDSFSTMEAAAGHLVVLQRFLAERQIDLEWRFLAKDFFKVYEIEALRDFCQLKFRTRTSDISEDSVFSLEELQEDDEHVANGTQYARMTTIASYIKWFANHLLEDCEQGISERIAAMDTQIREHRPSKKGRNQNVQDRALSDEQLDGLFEVLRLDSELNPFTESLRRRNRLMTLLLFHLGIRGGELLNIRIKDINFGKNQITVVRRADEKADTRTKQPLAKTLTRILPVKDTLMKDLHEYITKDRRKVENARKNDYLFVTHKAGPTVGQPLSIVSYHKVMRIVRQASPQLYAVTGHMLRHTWNHKFSLKMDEMDTPPSEEKQEKIRSYLMGWKEGSGSAKHYNKRFVREKAAEASLALQEDSGTRIPENLNHGN